jgi:hypothetical protein
VHTFPPRLLAGSHGINGGAKPIQHQFQPAGQGAQVGGDLGQAARGQIEAGAVEDLLYED